MQPTRRSMPRNMGGFTAVAACLASAAHAPASPCNLHEVPHAVTRSHEQPEIAGHRVNQQTFAASPPNPVIGRVCWPLSGSV